jgi:membrane-associated phospholipid phosphatase
MRTPPSGDHCADVPTTDGSALRPLPIALNATGLVLLLVAAEIVPRLVPHHDLATGLHNAREVVGMERRIGLPREQGPMRWLAARPALADAANIAYVAFHVPAIAATLVWTYVTRPRAFAWTRTVFVVAMVLTVAGYALWPTAPPRFLGDAPDGPSELYGSAARPSGDGAVNALAAFPSGHVVFALVAALPVVRWSRRAPLRALAAAYPIFVTTLVIATGHHFWIDVAGGATVVATAVVAAALCSARERARPRPSRAPDPRPGPCAPPRRTLSDVL